MLTRLIIESAHVSLLCDALGFNHRRPLRLDGLANMAERYAAARERGDGAALLSLGQELYRWLDGAEGWLKELLAQLEPPLVLEIEASRQPEASAWAILQAPWELLANDKGYLAADALLRFAPARRLGAARPPDKPDVYRLGIAFMAASPEELTELDYEREEATILNEAREVDLYVEESGDPDELGRRLSVFEPPLPVLQLSCHGHNAWKQVGGAPQPALMLEDERGGLRPISATDLLEALGACRPRLLMLSACLSAAAGESAKATQVADSLATAMVRAGLPAVIGWDGSVADVAATRFAGELYDNLGRRQTIIEAAAGARRALLVGTSTGAAGNKDGAEAAGIDQQLAAQQLAARRDWHLARVWLGPDGGGAVVGGTRKRSMLPHDYAYKQILTVKQDARLVVAGAAMFVGRRRELQQALRILAGSDHAGVLLHGLGRTGKSSLAARLVSRRQELTLAVVTRTMMH
jgi:hypothetical protein